MLRVVSGAAPEPSALYSALCGGAAYIFRARPSALPLARAADALLRDELRLRDRAGLRRAHDVLGAAKFAEAMRRARRRFGGDEAALALLARLFVECGASESLEAARRVHIDKLQLRVTSPRRPTMHVEDGFGELAAHRDTWASNLPGQINL